MLKVNVSPIWDGLNDWVSRMLTWLWPGARVITADVRMNPESPLFPVATIRRLTYSVTVDGFDAPSLNVCTLPYFESEKRWSHVACDITGGATKVPGVTVTASVVWCVTLPLVPNTFTEYGPVAVVDAAQTVSVEVPEFMIVVGVSEAVKPDGALVVSAIEPVNPPREITLALFDVHPPAATDMALGEAVSWKSWTLTVTMALCESDELVVPVTVTR